jgi:hypothetical protein
MYVQNTASSFAYEDLYINTFIIVYIYIYYIHIYIYILIGSLEGGNMYVQNTASSFAYEDGIILVRSAFLFVQGILAGFAFTSIGKNMYIYIHINI